MHVHVIDKNRGGGNPTLGLGDGIGFQNIPKKISSGSLSAPSCGNMTEKVRMREEETQLIFKKKEKKENLKHS